MTDTPIDRLRELHRPCPRPNCNSLYSHCDLCGQGAMGWPCDTIAALDALTVRLQEQVETNMELAGLAGQQQLDAIVLQARLDAATEQAEALAGALEAIERETEHVNTRRGSRNGRIREAADAALRAYREPWATVHAKYLDDQLVERCITCLERWPCKEDNHDDRR